MTMKKYVALAFAGALLSTPLVSAQAQSVVVRTVAPARAIRRDIPLTDMIRRAFAMGTRDSTGRPGAHYWQLWMDYTINARLDQATSRISGSETIVLHNHSDSTLNSVQIRLDQNLFAPNVPRAEVVTAITDGMQLTKLVVDGEPVDLAAPAPRRRFGQGADAAPPTSPTITGTNLTTATIHLIHPIVPNGTATIVADWNFEVPSSNGVRGIRMGRWGDSLYQVGQWYPIVSVYDDLRGWDTDPYLGPSEFYENLGHYDVHLDVPAGWLVGATGVLQNPEEVYTATTRERLSHVLESDSQRAIVTADERGPGQSTAEGTNGRLVWHFVADSVIDVAWATSDRFLFDATRANIPGHGEIPIYLMYEPGNAARFCTQGVTGRHALEFYSQLWMPYTYPSLTQVDGPEGGMEYPMFIMAAGSTDHEIGHQWWPMMVNTNETWYGFMDEGFNNWMNTLSAADRAADRAARGDTAQGMAAAREHAGTCPPPSANPNAGRFFGGRGRAQSPYWSINPPGGVATENGAGQRYGNISGNEREAPLMWDANYGGPNYSTQAYSISGSMLSMLGGIVGDSSVWKAMSGYAKAWRFKHPSPWDYAFYMSNALHRDLGWFWYYWLFTTESVDGSIAHVATGSNGTTVTVRQDGQMPSPVVLAVRFAPKGPAIRHPAQVGMQMLDSVTALVTYPVDVWFTGNRTFTAHLNFGSRSIESITLDPFGRFPDRDPSDNVWTSKGVGAGTRSGGG